MEVKLSTDRQIVAQGKTKTLYSCSGNDDLVDAVSNDFLTAFDEKKKDPLEGKGIYANRTNCNIFEYLRSKGVPVAYVEWSGDRSFIARRCTMLPYEVVARRVAYGSFLERYPESGEGEIFDDVVAELFLKTTDKKWRDKLMPYNDPFVEIDCRSKCIRVHNPHAPVRTSAMILNVREDAALRQDWRYFDNMLSIVKTVFLHLEEAFWEIVRGTLVDLKIEFGITSDHELVVADCITPDEFRLLIGGTHKDKQLFRNDEGLKIVRAAYEEVANLTDSFVV